MVAAGKLEAMFVGEDKPIHHRPQTRADCITVPFANATRPCPWVACKYHLLFDVMPKTGHLKFHKRYNLPELLPDSCALDVADRLGSTLEEVGQAIGVTRERVRQIELKILAALRLALKRAGLSVDDFDLSELEALRGRRAEAIPSHWSGGSQEMSTAELGRRIGKKYEDIVPSKLRGRALFNRSYRRSAVKPQPPEESMPVSTTPRPLNLLARLHRVRELLQELADHRLALAEDPDVRNILELLQNEAPTLTTTATTAPSPSPSPSPSLTTTATTAPDEDSSGTKRRARAKPGATIRFKIEKFFMDNPSQIVGPTQLAGILRMNKNSFGRHFNELTGDKIEKVSRGKYRAKRDV